MGDMRSPVDIPAARALAEKATPGPWTHLYAGQCCEHVCIEPVDHDLWVQPADAEFISASRFLVPALLDELEAAQARVRELEQERLAFTSRLGYGDNTREGGPAAALHELVDPIEEAFQAQQDHFDCPDVCGRCGERLADTACEHCNGSGCGPGTATGAYDECKWCAGDGKVHPGCAEMSYADLVARVRELEATVQREIYAAWDDGNGCGLDGWVGPERGTEPDDYAIRARDRYVEKRLASLRGSDD